MEVRDAIQDFKYMNRKCGQKKHDKTNQYYIQYDNCTTELYKSLQSMKNWDAARFIGTNYFANLILNSCSEIEYKKKYSLCQKILKIHNNR